MSSTDEAPDRAENDADRQEPATGEETTQVVWKPPERSDQARGEEVVQVNDAYTGGGPPPQDESHTDDEQHPTGG
jgi:hypothetical protein